MSVEEKNDIVLAPERENAFAIALAETEARARIMKSILPQLVAVCHESNIMDLGGKPYINNDGCQKIARIAGISFGKPRVTISTEQMPPVPEEVYPDSGKVKRRGRPARTAYIVEVEGEAILMGQTVMEFGGASSEDGFFDRPNESPVETRLEVRKKAMANWQGRCVRTLLGLQGMSFEELARVGFDRSRMGKVEYKEGRHSAAKDTTSDQTSLDDTRAKIREQILADISSNAEAAAYVLEEMTAFPGDKGIVPGRKRVDALTEKQVFRLWGEIKPGGKKRDIYDGVVADAKDRFNLWPEKAPE